MYVDVYLCIPYIYVYLLIYNVPGQVCEDCRVPAVFIHICMFMYVYVYLCISYVYLLIYNVPGQVCKDFRVPAADGLVKVGFHGLYMAYVGHTRM